MGEPQYMVAVVGAGPAGLFAARKLAEEVHTLCYLTVMSNPAAWLNMASIRINSK